MSASILLEYAAAEPRACDEQDGEGLKLRGASGLACWQLKSWQGAAQVCRVNFMVKLLRAHGGCLGRSRRRRTWQAAISLAEPQAGIDPGNTEWGNPRW